MPTKKRVMDELDSEAQKVWDMLNNDAYTKEPDDFIDVDATVKSTIAPKGNPMVEQLELMIKNSEMVILDCDIIYKEAIAKEKYFCANEARVAKLLHLNLIARLRNIIEGKPIFEGQPRIKDVLHVI